MSSNNETLNEVTRQYHAANYESAKSLCEAIVKVEPKNSEALHFLGLINHNLGAYVIASEWIDRALKLDPKNAVYHYNFGETLRAQDDIDKAIVSYYRALNFDPSFVNAYTKIGILCLSQNRLPEAFDMLRRAATYTPTDAAALARLGLAQLAREDSEGALVSFARAIRFETDNSQYVQYFVETLNALPLPSVPLGVLTELRACFDLEDVAHQPLMSAAAAVLKRDERFSVLSSLAGNEDITVLMAAAAGSVFDDFLSEPLLLGMLAKSVITDDKLIQALTILRKIIILQGDTETAPADFIVSRRRQFVTALALQCFATDFAWFETRRESAAAGYLIAEVRRGLDAIAQGTDKDAWDLEMWNRLVVVAMYRPLQRIEGIENLMHLGLAAESPYRRMLIQQQIVEPLREKSLSLDAIKIGSIGNSDEERQFQQVPYPRWYKFSPVEPMTLAKGLQSLIPGFQVPEFAYGQVKILVAGCGTGQRAIRMAAAYQNAFITAVDPSIANIAYAMRMAEDLHVENIKFFLCDRHSLNQIDNLFHVVDSGETLLWTSDALTPWRALAELLLPGGLMRFDVRVERQREGLLKARDLVTKEGLVGDIEGIRAARQLLLKLPANDPARRIVTADGFYNAHRCKDMLFPSAEEARFNLAQLGQLMAQFDLSFLAYEIQRPSTMSMFLENFGSAADPSSLYQWTELEVNHPMALSTTHRIWCQREV